MSRYQKRAVVTGAGGFIGHHLVKYLVQHDYWVRGVDLKLPEFSSSPAQDFLLLDLRNEENCEKALTLAPGESFDEVYHLAADMGGMGYIHRAECEIMHNSALMNIHMPYCTVRLRIPRYFFSSSVCVYRDMDFDEPELSEAGAYPALPHNEYGWEKLYAERAALAYARRYGLTVRIARLKNCYGHEGTWRGGREKAPAAICRKVAEAEDGGTIAVWGQGTAVRSYTHIHDTVRGIFMLMQSDLEGPANIGAAYSVSVNELVSLIARIAGKKLTVQHVEGPVGVKSRNFSIDKICSIGWQPEVSLEEGLRMTYAWVEQEVRRSRLAESALRAVSNISTQDAAKAVLELAGSGKPETKQLDAEGDERTASLHYNAGV